MPRPLVPLGQLAARVLLVLVVALVALVAGAITPTPLVRAQDPGESSVERVLRRSRHHRPPPTAADFVAPASEPGDAWPSDFRISVEEQEARTADGAEALTTCCAFFPLALLASIVAAWYFGPTARERALR